jgi:hypothetical protein
MGGLVVECLSINQLGLGLHGSQQNENSHDKTLRLVGASGDFKSRTVGSEMEILQIKPSQDISHDAYGCRGLSFAIHVKIASISSALVADNVLIRAGDADVCPIQ